MKLEVDKSHKKIDISKLKDPLKRVTIGFLGTTIAISLYGGLLPTKAYAADEQTSYTETINTEAVEIPEEYRYDIAWKVGKDKQDVITKEDLSKFDYLYLGIDNPNVDLSFLQYCTNLKTFSIFIRTDNTDFLKRIPVIPNVELLFISDLYEDIDLPKENLTCIKNLPSLKTLELNGLTVAPGCEEALNQVEELDIGYITNCDIDFSKLTNLKKLIVKNIRPYNLAVFLNSTEYETLKQHGVEIEFDTEENKRTYENASQTIDEIVATLGVNKDNSDQEKLDAILIYVLERLSYDKEVSAALESGEDHSELTQSFYEGGALYGALEKETSICGNYAALVEALMDRLDVSEKSTILHSSNHAWNLIMIDGEPYYVDSTWLDGLTVSESSEKNLYDEDGHLIGMEITFESKKAEDYLKKGDTRLLQWYKENPDPEHISIIDHQSSHVPNFVPGYMTIENHAAEKANIEEEELSNTEVEDIEETMELPMEEDITNEKVKIKIGKKEIIITAGALVGVMSALGAAVAVKKKKERERRRRAQRNAYYSTYDDPFSSSYDDSFNSSSDYGGYQY